LKREIREAHEKEIERSQARRKKSMQLLFEAEIRHQNHIRLADQIKEKKRLEELEREKRWSPRRMKTQLQINLASSPRIPMPSNEPTPWYNKQSE
jgi:hypothetical protein